MVKNLNWHILIRKTIYVTAILSNSIIEAGSPTHFFKSEIWKTGRMAAIFAGNFNSYDALPTLFKIF